MFVTLSSPIQKYVCSGSRARLVLPFWYQLTQVFPKRPLNSGGGGGGGSDGGGSDGSDG